MFVTILTVAGLIIAIFIILKVLKSILIFKLAFKIVSLVMIAFVLIMGFSAYTIIKDANDFRKNFETAKNLFVIADDKAISAFELENNSYRVIDDLSYVSDSYEKYEFSNINDDYYKIALIKTDSLDYLDEIKIEELKITLKAQQVKSLLESATPTADLKNLLKDEHHYSDAQLNQLKLTDEELKAYLSSYVMSSLFDPKNMNILLSNIKADNIVMYENTALFKSIKYAPSFLIKDLTSNKSLIN